jgi:hypothetical protein
MLIQDYATNPPGVKTPGYRLKPVKTGSGVLERRFMQEVYSNDSASKQPTFHNLLKQV